VLVALGSVWYARQSAKAATRSADLAEVVEAGRHHGWRIEPRANTRVYTLRNVGTVNARNVNLSGDYQAITFHGADREEVNIAAGQARLFTVTQTFGDRGGEVHITWTPDLPGAEPMTWTESPPVPPFRPPLDDANWRNIRKAIERLADDR
jgi:hypothetical protein